MSEPASAPIRPLGRISIPVSIPPVAPHVPPMEPPATDTEEIVVKRRRYRRRRPGINATYYLGDPVPDPNAGLFTRLFRRDKAR